MKPKLPANLLETLRQSGQKPPWKCKLQLRHGRTVYGAGISSEGEITSEGGRAIYSASDISFSPATIENVTFCAT
jgi:hypothetical protein